MIKCERCGKRIDPDSRFCKYCGAAADSGGPGEAAAVRYCAGCGARVPVGGLYCLVCGVKAGQAPPVSAEPDIKPGRMPTGPFSAIIPEEGPSASSSVARDKNMMTGAAFLMLLILLAGVAVVGIWRFLPYILPVSVPSPGEGIAYVREGGTLMLSFPDREPYTVTEDFAPPDPGATDTAAKTGPDGRYFAYLNANGFEDGGALYLLDLSRLDRPEIQKPEGVLISENAVKDYEFSAKGNYLIYLSGMGGLYAYDYNNLWLLDTGVNEIIEVGEKQVLYSKNVFASAGKYDIYLRTIDKNTDDKIQIAQNAGELLDWTNNYSSFVYTQLQYGGYSGRNKIDVMHYDAKLYQTQTLVSGADTVLEASAEQKTVVFAKRSYISLRYEDLISDTLAASDKYLKEPDPGDFGLDENYMEVIDGFSSAVAGQRDTEMEDMYYEAYAAYLKALDSYGQKLARDAMRARAIQAVANASQIGLNKYELAIYRDNSIRVIDENVVPLYNDSWRETFADIVRCNLAEEYIAYVRSMPSELTSIGLSAFAEDMPSVDLDEYIQSNIPRQLCISTFNSEPKEVYETTGNNRIIDIVLTPGLGGIYFTTSNNDSEDGQRKLYYAEVQEGTPLEPLAVDSEIEILPGTGELFNGSLLYIKHAVNGVGDLYGIKERQNPFIIAEDISLEPVLDVVNEGKSMLYYRRYGNTGEGQAKGELYLIERQERFIVGGVYACDYRDDKLIYLLRDRSELGTSELCVYREGGVLPIDTGVTHIIAI